MKKKVIVYFATFFSLILFFLLSMILVHLIPSTCVASNAASALETLNNEGGYPRLFFSTEASQLDNVTDIVMIQRNLESELGVLQEAMGGYERYWHGYQIYLRPLLIFFNYTEIRYISVIVFFVLLFLVVVRLYKKLGIKVALTFLISILSVNIMIIPVSLQFVSVFNISFIFMLILSSDKIVNSNYVPLCFMVGGMLTNFIDFLTVPIVTLGLPLVVYLLLMFEKNEKNWQQILKSSISICVLWFLGYGLCWASKWALSSIITGKNVFSDAINTMFFRTMGNEEYPVDRWGTLKLNFRIFRSQARSLMWFNLILLLVLLVLACIYRTNLNKYKQMMFFVVVALFPYLWYFVLSNHSEIHYWFTYRAQIVSLFSILMALVNVINWGKLKSDLKVLKNKAVLLYGKIVQKK